MRESDARFLERLLDDVEPSAGPRLEAVAIDAQPVGGGVRVEVALADAGRSWTVAATGTSLIEAASAIRTEVVIARLAHAFREIVVDAD